MRSIGAVLAVTALTMIGLITIPPNGFADEQLTITGNPREVKIGDGQLQVIPTERRFRFLSPSPTARAKPRVIEEQADVY